MARCGVEHEVEQVVAAPRSALGASLGIGAGLVAGFRAAGYAVIGTARSIDPVDDADLVTVPGDIADAETARRLSEHALERFGRIDTLVNNAGLYIGKDFTDYTIADYDAVASVNLVGFLHMTQAVLGPMVAQRSGHIVNITTSLVEHANSSSHSPLASLTKAASGQGYDSADLFAWVALTIMLTIIVQASFTTIASVLERGLRQ